VQNTQGDRTILYSVTVNIRISSDPNIVQLVEEDFLKSRKATVIDAISRILRSADHKDMTQPGLETLKRQIRFELSSMLGDDTIIQQVLVPEFTPLPTGF
jgi:flagellar basal body-associated protein FliL